ncbi:AB hydrolase superfamily protein YdjP [Aquisphaera giovannonii]|uniref:AB hydrolase superfamily protein YdjP n=1 Tax=Aquisphaera giovannonii TaxID=406548 RepID=A0A5B9WDT6_9BACT|nr:alpha/beta fold hydrolase [Aquisphaera giovannonii]QEH38235.1 AB hydrolase superfamily protein YdjP [Aquisphaera giovannonii]
MRLAYSDTRSSPIVVLLHGFPLSRAMWDGQVEALGAVCRVIAPDLRGHGESESPEGVYTMDAMADDVIELLDALGIDRPVVLGGLSMGGYVALSLALRHPARICGLMLMDTRAAADTPETARGREETARTVLHEGDGHSMIETMIPRLFGKATREKLPHKVGAMLAVMERTAPQGIAGALRGMAARPDRRGELGRIAIPTLVLVGEDDVVAPVDEAREIAGMIPDARLVVIPAAGHLAPFENPAATNAAILGFLAEIPARAAAAPA